MRRSRIKRRGRDRFEGLRDDKYREWIRQQPCALAQHKAHSCWGRVTYCHIKPAGNGGPDHGNLYPGCVSAHNLEHAKHWHWIRDRYGVDLKAEAARLWAVYKDQANDFSGTAA